MNQKFVLPFIFICLLSACNNPSVEELIQEKDLLQLYKLECEIREKEGKNINTEKCRKVVAASVEIAKQKIPNSNQQNTANSP